MSNAEKGFVPLTYAEENGSDRASFQFDLPEYVQKDNIGVNLRTIDTACRIGGIRDIGFHGVSGMERSSESPEIVGMTEKGEALAGKSSSRQIAPLYGAQALSGPFPLPHQMRSTEAHIHINLDDISDKASSSLDSDGVRSPKMWSKEIDKATRSSVDTLGQMQLLNLLTGPEKAVPLAFDALHIGLASNTVPIVDFDPQIPDPADLAARLIFINAGLNLLDYVSTRIKFGKEPFNALGFRLSLFNGPQFDRAMILKAYTKTKTFVKEIKPKS